MLRKISTVSLLLISVMLVSGCMTTKTNAKIEELELRMKHVEDNELSIKAYEAHMIAEDALRAAKKAQQTADEANERALRMLGNKVH